MRFRASDEAEWSFEFDAEDAAELARGARAGFAAWVARARGGADLQRRLAEVDAWESERLARPGSTEQNRENWQRQARHWRWEAVRQHGLTGTPRLHALMPSGTWVTPGNRLPAPEVSWNSTAAAAAEWWADAQRSLAHDAAIDSSGSNVEAALRRNAMHVAKSDREDS